MRSGIGSRDRAMPEMQQGLEPGDTRAKCQKSKEENSVNREIATLLLNLASRTAADRPGADHGGADHFKSEMETEAMDLSKVGDMTSDHLPLARSSNKQKASCDASFLPPGCDAGLKV